MVPKERVGFYRLYVSGLLNALASASGPVRLTVFWILNE
eukprot:COSAG02_NODE_195_length_29750_cov_79.793329_20_plen_39_part_00